MPTISGLLRSTARRVPETTALKFGERTYTYAELDAEVDRVAHALSRLGLAKGDRFALMATNSDHFVISFYAALRVGAVALPINPASASPELNYLLSDSGATVLAFDPSLTSTVSASSASGLPDTTRHLVCLGESPEYPNLYTLPSDTAEFSDVGEDLDLALILYTSGTTGDPKGAMFDHRRSLWTTTALLAGVGYCADDRFLHVAPLYHAAQLCVMLIPAITIGATNVLHTGFDPTAVLETLESEQITVFFGVPTMFQFLLREPGLRERDLTALRIGLFGAAPMPPSTVSELTDLLPNTSLTHLCGQTEGGPGGIYCDNAQVRQRPEASGRQAIPFMECKVVDHAGREVEPGDVGEVVLRGESVTLGYWNKPEETARTLRDGWLHTGDLARLDEDGYMTLVDRLKDMIITGGRNVYSAEVEKALTGHPDILECAVVGRPHPDYGESIVAVVTPRANTEITLESVRAYCADHLARYKIPHDLMIAEIPRNPSGKALKHRLRDRVTEQTEGVVES